MEDFWEMACVWQKIPLSCTLEAEQSLSIAKEQSYEEELIYTVHGILYAYLEWHLVQKYDGYTN